MKITIPEQHVTLTLSAYEIDIPDPVVTPPVVVPPVVVPPVVVPPVVTPPSAFWVYKAGIFGWGGDYSFSAKPKYQDSVGIVNGVDIAVLITGPYGGFLPYAGGSVPLWSFDDSPYNYLVFDLKPTIDNQTAQVYFVKVGDIPVGVVVDPFKYGPIPIKDIWGTYKIPLADLGVKGTKVYKFAIQDQTGKVGHTLYLNNIGFTS